MAFGNIGTIWAEIGLETKRLSTGVTTAKMKLSELDRQALLKTASINAKLNKIGAGLTSVGRNMSRYVTLPLLAVGVAATKAGMDFDSGMTKSLAIMRDITPQIRKQMELTAKDVVKYTTFSAKEGADAYFYLASAGLDTAQSIQALPRVARFAQAGQFDLALATDLLTDAQSALGLTIRDDVVANMENMTRVSDVLVKANTLSNATVRQFSESLTNKAGPALRMLNKDIEEGTAVLAVYADQGIKGAEAGNYLNIILRDLQRSSINNAEAFKQFGVDVFDASGQVRNIADIIGDLEDALDGMSDKEKRATLMMMGFQDRSISAMMALLGTSDAIRSYEKELRSATGFTEDVAAKQMESFTAQVEQLKNELINVGISIFDILRPRLESLIEWIKKSIDWFDSLTDIQKNLIINMGIFAAAIGPVAYALSGLTKIVVGLNTAMTSLGVTLGVTTGVATGMVAALAIGLARFGVDVYTYINAFKALGDETLSWQRKFVNFIPFFDKFAVTFGRWMGLTDAQIKNIEKLTGVTGEATEFTWKYSGAIDQSAASSVKAKIAHQDNEATIKSIMEQYNLTRESAIEYAKAEGYLKDETEDTTEAIDDQTESVDDLRSSYNKLIGTLFDGITTYNDFEESQIAVKEAQAEVNKLIKEGKQETDEYTKAENDLDDSVIRLIEDSFALSTSIYATTEQKEEARKKAVELGLGYVNMGRISIEQFQEMASEFGISSDDIIRDAEEMGIELDTATKDRTVVISVDATGVPRVVQKVLDDLGRIKSKTITITVRKYYEALGAVSGGGIVGYDKGGVVGSDGARLPILSAAYGMVTPQRGKEIPVLAHENEVILNTSQQKNIAEWIMGKARTVPQIGNALPGEIILHNIINLDGRVAYENWEKYDLREQARRI